MMENKVLNDNQLAQVAGGEDTAEPKTRTITMERIAINEQQCVGCGNCASNCPAAAIYPEGAVYKISMECVQCGYCMDFCPTAAIYYGTFTEEVPI